MIAVVGNKSDLYDEAQVSLEDAHEFAKECKAEICKECSAKDNVGIADLFSEIGLKLYKKHKAKVIDILIINILPIAIGGVVIIGRQTVERLDFIGLEGKEQRR